MVSKKTLVGALGLLLGIALVAVSNSASPSIAATYQAQLATPAGGIGADIPSPTEWVPFVARARKVAVNDGVSRIEMAGRYYRRSDGSTRFETGPENGPIRVIHIKNVAHSRSYLLFGEQWQSNPMLLSEKGYQPKIRREDMRGLEKQAEAISGFLIYKFTDHGGVVAMQAPDLNFFALRTTFQNTTQEFYDVQLGEQPDDLFEPPSGATVEEKTEFRGIVSKRPPAPQQR